MINASDVEARNCRIEPGEPVPAVLGYQTTDPATNAATGTPDTPVNIAPRGAQSFVFSLETRRNFNLTEISLSFVCDNAAPAVIRDRVNLFRLSASNPFEADIIAQAATIGNDGFVRLPDESRVGVFAVATSNVGDTRTMTVRAESGEANPPVTYEICQTDPGTGACATPRAETQTLTMAAGQNYTFGVFVRPSGYVPRNPGLYRAIVVFEDTLGVERGSTSVAIRTESGTPPAQAVAQLGFPSGQTFQIASADALTSVDVSIDAQGFVLGTDGRAALYHNGRLVNRYDSAQTVSLDLPGGQHDIAVRLVDMAGEFVFPDARAEGRVTVQTGGVPRLMLASGVVDVEPYEIANIVAENVFPQSSVYRGTFEGQAVDVMSAGGGRMGFLVPDMGGFAGNGVLSVNIDGTDFTLNVPVSAPAVIINPGEQLADMVADIRSGLEAERDAAIARRDIPYADAMIAAINQIAIIQSEIIDLSLEEQAVSLRLLRNLYGPTASPLFLPASINGPNSFSSCAEALAAVPLRAKKGIIVGFVFVGAGASILGTTGITPIGAFAGSFTFLAGVALIDAHRTEINTTIDQCFESELEFAAQGTTYTSGSEMRSVEALDGPQNATEIGFVSNDQQIVNLGIRRDPFQNMRQYLGEMIEAMESFDAYIPDAVLTPTLAQLSDLRDGLSVYYPDASEFTVTVTGGDVELDYFGNGDLPGAYILGFYAESPGEFTFQIEYPGRTITVPAYIETEPPLFDFRRTQLRILPDGLMIPVPTLGNVQSFHVVQNPLGGNFTYDTQEIDGVRWLQIVPRDGFFGAEAVEFVLTGRGGTRESHFVTMITTGGFYYPHDAQNGILSVGGPINRGQRKRFNCFQLFTSNYSSRCLLRFNTNAGGESRRNGIIQTVDISGLPDGMGRVLSSGEYTTEVELVPPRDQFGNPQEFDITVTVNVSQGSLTESFQVDTAIREVDPNVPCDFCSYSQTFVAGTTAGNYVNLPTGSTSTTVLDYLIDGPDHGRLIQNGRSVRYVPNEGFTGLDRIILRSQENIPNVATVEYTETIDLYVAPNLRRDRDSLYLTLPANENCVRLYGGPPIVNISSIVSSALRYGSFNAETGVLCVVRSALEDDYGQAGFLMDAGVEYGSDTLLAGVWFEGGIIGEEWR